MLAKTQQFIRRFAPQMDRLKNVLVSAAVVVFFIVIVFYYYQRLRDQQYHNIINQGLVSFMKSAEQVGEYFSSSIHVINVNATRLARMRESRRSDKEVTDYLVAQTTAVKETIFPDTTGLYAFIDGKYFDGNHWQPPEGYVVTERPWYKKTVENAGQVTFIEPYLDAETNELAMTIAQGLPDGKSVVAMDVSLRQLQTISDLAMKESDLECAAIIDSQNKIVALSEHVDNAGGKKREALQTMMAAVVNKARAQQNPYFDHKFANANYLIYCHELQKTGWLCLAVKNATIAFQPLKYLLAGTIAVVVVIALVMFRILDKSNRRYLRSAKLNRQLSAIADSYCVMIDLDIPNDQFTLMTTRVPKVAETLNGGPGKTSDLMPLMLERFVGERSKAAMLAFYDLATIEKRLSGTKTIAQEFVNAEGQWRRGRFVVSQRAENGGLDHVLWITEDIDLEKRRREQLIDMSERAIAASEAKSTFLSNMSHEIRTPINAVLGMNEMILRECEDANILAYSDSIKTAGNTLLGLINDILDFSKIESGKMKIIPVDYDLSSVINDLVSMIHTRVDAKGLTLRLGFDKGLPKWLNGDEVRLKQVITNILTNAVKYTEKGSVTFSIGFERLDGDPDSVILNVAVQDTGIGIKEGDMKKLFAQFERIEEHRNRHIEGTGLGMNIATSLLAMMGSCLKVNSVYGSGSVFYFAIKQKVVKWEPLGDYGASFNALVKGRKRYHERFTAPDAVVLMVDDNPMNLMVFKSLLKQTKVRVDLAADGVEGLRLTHDKKYDMIFLDHMMPGLDGIAALHELRAQGQNPNLRTPAICLTANAISGAREQYIAEGFDDYLTKPIDSGKLEEMLMAYLPPEKVRRPGPGEAAVDAFAPDGADDGEPVPANLAALDACGIDVAVGTKNSGSLDAYLPLLKIFHESMDETAAAIDGFYAAADVKNYAIKVHALKSSARIIGAEAFAEEAQKLENAAKAGDLAYVRAHHAGFLAAYRQFREPLAGALGVAPAAAKPEAAPEFLAEAYAEIRAGAEDMDSDRLEGVLQEMADYRPPPSDEGLWGRLREAAGRYDYEALTRLLDEAGK